MKLTQNDILHVAAALLLLLAGALNSSLMLVALLAGIVVWLLFAVRMRARG